MESTLEHFRQGAFSGDADGITDWLAFSFFTALGQDFTTIDPHTGAARVLVGVHLILSAGWALVLFAAVMSYIGPKLDEIAGRHTKKGGNGAAVAARRSQGDGCEPAW